jgi:hypothetical protein
MFRRGAKSQTLGRSDLYAATAKGRSMTVVRGW